MGSFACFTITKYEPQRLHINQDLIGFWFHVSFLACRSRFTACIIFRNRSQRTNAPDQVSQKYPLQHLCNGLVYHALWIGGRGGGGTKRQHFATTSFL